MEKFWNYFPEVENPENVIIWTTLKQIGEIEEVQNLCLVYHSDILQSTKKRDIGEYKQNLSKDDVEAARQRKCLFVGGASHLTLVH